MASPVDEDRYVVLDHDAKCRWCRDFLDAGMHVLETSPTGDIYCNEYCRQADIRFRSEPDARYARDLCRCYSGRKRMVGRAILKAFAARALE